MCKCEDWAEITVGRAESEAEKRLCKWEKIAAGRTESGTEKGLCKREEWAKITVGGAENGTEKRLYEQEDRAGTVPREPKREDETCAHQETL